MELSIYLAKLIGLYMLIVSGVMLVRRPQFELVVKDIFSSQGLLAFSGVVALIAGLAIAIGHPVWEASWRIGITLVGYMAIFQGISRIAFPEEVQKCSECMLVGRNYWFILLFMFAVGVFFTYCGFFLSH